MSNAAGWKYEQSRYVVRHTGPFYYADTGNITRLVPFQRNTSGLWNKIVVIIFIVGIFIADYPAAALTGGIEIPVAPAAEGQMLITFIVIPENTLAAMVTDGRQLIDTGFTVGAVVKMVGAVWIQNTAAVVAS